MPVDDMKWKFICQFKMDLVSMQVKHIAPKIARGPNGLHIEEQPE
jgi:hypothetical protein